MSIQGQNRKQAKVKVLAREKRDNTLMILLVSSMALTVLASIALGNLLLISP